MQGEDAAGAEPATHRSSSSFEGQPGQGLPLAGLEPISAGLLQVRAPSTPSLCSSLLLLATPAGSLPAGLQAADEGRIVAQTGHSSARSVLIL